MSEHNIPASFVKEFVAAVRAEVAHQWQVFTTPLPQPVEIPPNLARIEAIPYSVLPDMSPARDALICLALRGLDVDAYQPMGSTEWRIWCRPASPDLNGRYTVEEWKAVCDQELARLLPPGTWGRAAPMTSTPEPMSDEQLQVIRERVKTPALDSRGWPLVHPVLRDRTALLAEVERLKAALDREHEDRTREYEYANADAEIAAKRIRELIAENAAMREIVQPVASLHVSVVRCPWQCEGRENGTYEGEHAPDCPITKARALPAESEGSANAD